MSDDCNHAGEYRHTRRDHLRGILGGSALATGLGSTGLASADAARDGPEETTVTTTEGTNVAVTASPDGESIVMDHAGILFHLPREGGKAEQLTDVELEPAYPDYAPDGSRVVFQSYVNGNYNLWTMAPDGGDLRQLTDHTFYDDREPVWSPDGNTVAFSSDRGGDSYDIWTIDVSSQEIRQLTHDDAENYLPTWSPDGTEIAYVSEGGKTIRAINRDGDTRTLVEAGPKETLHAPAWGPSRDVAYVRVAGENNSHADLMISGEQITDGEDVFALPPDWLSEDELLYTADGTIRALDRETGVASEVPFSTSFDIPVLDYEPKSYVFDERSTKDVQGIQTPTLSPDGERIAFVALNDLWVMTIGESPRRLTDDVYYQVDPTWSPDGRYLAYSSDEAGTQDVYVRDTQTDTRHRVTSLDGEAAIAARWSPDGSQIAFQKQNGATFTVDVDTSGKTVEGGEVQQVVEPLFEPSKPTWSSDGSVLAMAALKTYSDRFDEGTNQILTVDIETGEKSYHPPGGEFDSISPRHNDGPVWSPDGRWMAFVVESTLRVMPVTEDGKPAGPAKQITDEVTDAPAWSGDSEWLLYLNNGRLKKIKRDGSETREVPLPLDYRPEYPDGRKVVYAGRMWDATSSDVHENVVIEVLNNRIERITPDSSPPEGPYVDASDLTVIPGLWDAHQHRTYSEESLGARQGLVNLAFGITSTVDRAAFVYHAVENREALQASEAVAPRYFMTGELIDGSRTNFPTNRTTDCIEQIPLEMSRAIELDYDFVKSYDRLNANRMALMEDTAHDELGVPIASHYIAPGAFVGHNGTTHLDVTQRFGFSRAESATNKTYDDVIQFHSAGQRKRRWTVTTFFHNNFITLDELEDDPRLQLFPPWRRQSLLNDIGDNTDVPTDPDCSTDTCKNVSAFKEIVDAGGLVVAGTDVPLVVNGVSLHGNLRPLTAYGFTPHEALLTATRFAAEHQGVEEDLGTLEEGKLADMTFVEGNPLERIEDAMKVRMTMKGGELFTLEELLEPFSSEDAGEER